MKLVAIAAKQPDALVALAELVSSLEVLAFSGDAVPAVATSGLPPKDQLVLAAAIRCNCDVLLTGDRLHFGQLYNQTIAGVTVHSPNSLVELLFPG